MLNFQFWLHNLNYIFSCVILYLIIFWHFLLLPLEAFKGGHCTDMLNHISKKEKLKHDLLYSGLHRKLDAKHGKFWLPVLWSSYRTAGSPEGVRLLLNLWKVFFWLHIAIIIHFNFTTFHNTSCTILNLKHTLFSLQLWRLLGRRLSHLNFKGLLCKILPYGGTTSLCF